WLSELCGSLSTSSTRRPARARAPARLWVVVDLPTPPFMLTRLITSTATLPRDVAPGRVSAGRTAAVHPNPHGTLWRTAAVRYATAPTRENGLRNRVRSRAGGQVADSGQTA